MPNFGSKEDRALQHAIERWKGTACETLAAIEGFRDEPGGFFAVRDAAWGQEVFRFRANTSELIAAASAGGMDPRPLQRFLAVVLRWNGEDDPDKLPGPTGLERRLDAALAILDALELGIRA